MEGGVLSPTDSWLGFDPAEMPLADAHRMLLHCVAPRPIALTSTLSADGIPNLAPFSYFMAGGANPPSVVISPLTPRGTSPPPPSSAYSVVFATGRPIGTAPA